MPLTFLLLVCLFPDSAHVVARMRGDAPLAYSCTRSIVRAHGALHVAFTTGWALPIGESSDVYYTCSTDEGISWSAWENISRSDSFEVHFPSLSVDSSGAVHCTWLQFWVDSAGGRHYDCFYSRRDTSHVTHGWSVPVNLSGVGPNSNNWPVSAVAADIRGRIHVVYEGDYSPTRYDGAIYHCIYQGDSWTRPYCLTPAPTWQNSCPSVVCDRRGRLHVAWLLWQYGTNHDDTVYYSVYDTSWSTPEVVAAWGTGYTAPCIAVDSAGTPQVVFAGGSQYIDLDAYHARRESGSWRLTNLSNAPGNSRNASITVQKDGGAVVVWQEENQHFELYMRKFDGRSWSPTQNISADSSCSSVFPQLAFPPGQDRIDIIWFADSAASRRVMYMGLSPAVSAVSEKGQPLSRSGAPTIARGILNLSLSPCPRVPVSLLDATGRRVMSLQPGPNDVSALSPGVYFVREEPQSSSHKPQAIRKVILTR